MARESRYDSIDINPVEISYDPYANPYVDSNPHATAMNNFIHTPFGTLTTRAPFFQLTPIQGTAAYPVRLWEYSTLPKDSIIYRYIIASVYIPATGLYSLYYTYYTFESLSGGSPTSVTPAWTQFPTTRDARTSTRAHVMTCSRGRAYIKGFPEAGSTEDIGTLVFDANADPTTPNIYLWGLEGPTAPATIQGDVTKLTSAATATATTLNVTSTTGFPASGTLWVDYEVITYSGVTATSFTGCTRGTSGTDAATHDTLTAVVSRDWSASDHKVDVNSGWYYAYAWKSVTGQISNRSDIQRNPDLMPSFTGPFFDLVPKITVQGHADTTNIPKIVVFRTLDGGGTFYFLEEITNTGSGDITYIDDSFGTGASSSTFNDPVPDAKLDTGYVAPSLTTNSPPPTVNPPLVVGDATVSRSCYDMETYLGRIFFPIDNYLYFSSREELREGVGEECFVSGNSGNFIIFNELITGLAATFEALYIGTTDGIYKLTGTSRETFQITKISNIAVQGGEQKKCMVAADQDIYFHSADFGIFYRISNDTISPISDLLANTQNNTSSQLMYYRSQRYELLIWACNGTPSSGGGTGSLWSIYNIGLSKRQNRHIWSGQWTLYNSTSACVGRITGGTSVLLNGNYNPTATKFMVRYMSSPIGNYAGPADEGIDDSSSISTTNVGASLTLSGIKPPAGNHINLVNLPTRYVKFSRVQLYATTGGNYSLPQSVGVHLDGTPAVTGTFASTSRVPPSTYHPVNVVAFPVDASGYMMTQLIITSSNTSILEIWRIIVETSSNFSAVP